MKPHRMMTIVAVGMALTLQNGAALAKQRSDHHSRGHGAVAAARDGVAIQRLAACPPGLAKKDPACIPPGQAKKAGGQLLVGQIIDLDRVHMITRPGRYGLSGAPSGNRYAIVDGKLIRVDPKTGQILSILRSVEAILD